MQLVSPENSSYDSMQRRSLLIEEFPTVIVPCTPCVDSSACSVADMNFISRSSRALDYMFTM